METFEPKTEETIKVEKPKQDRFLAISILIAGVLVGGSIFFSSIYKTNTAAPANNGVANGGDNGAAAPTSTANNNGVMALGARDAVLGSANAPVTIVEYGDYQCPFCGQYFSQTESQIVANYVTPGKVKLVFRNFAFLGQESIAAAGAAECAEDQNKLWAFHDALYTGKLADEAKGGGENDGFYSRALFLQLAQKLGLNVPTFTSCIDSNKYGAQVAQEKTAASGSGVNSTPTFFINGQQVLGAQPYSVFKSTIDALLKA